LISADEFKRRKQAIVRAHATSSNAIGLLQSATTLLPLAALCWVAVWGLENSLPVTLAAAVGITLMLLRVFVMLHECGHGALFASRALNRGFGFLYGVICGMPQYVWSKHHDFHHCNNGNWDKYRGPLSTLSTDEYDALSEAQRRRYRRVRHIAFAPLAGFVYLIFNPRVNWLIGSAALLVHVLRGRGVATFQTRRWKTWREYRHQTANNLVLISAWVALAALVGAGNFFALYLTTLSLSGGIGIILFTVQHNFAESYAAPTATWDYDKSALAGTSFLVLPRWLNWVTANIGYHHVHHLSAAIPNHRLVACHEENADLFVDVPRLTLKDVPASLRCVLWDRKTERIISCAEYERAAAQQKLQPQALAS
jgi:omega-6 fatty acid desaturase (delta-12 desaturase)